MRGLRGRLVLIGATLLAVGVSSARAGANGSASSRTQQEVTAVRQLVSSINARDLAAAAALFTPSANLQVSNRQWRGRGAIEGWWRAELAHRVHLSLRSAVQTQSSVADAIWWRITQGGDCPRGCLERTTWRFAGSRFTRLTLTPLRAPVPPTYPTPPKIVPPTPTGPPPKVTPTIPT